MAGFDGFHPAIDAWFARRFAEGPTPAQERGWPLIAAGQHTLIAAPTGSGKTLAAFLVGIDQLLREACEGSLPDETRVIYVSPLKALAVDVAKNLVEPLAEMHALAAEQGRALPEIRGERAHLRQRLDQVLRDVDRQRLQRRDVDDARLVRQ